MTSNINYSAIQTDYPVAGQDNNSQGFRDNFSAIHDGLALASAEISTLQTNAVLTRDVETSQDPVINILNGSAITQGTFNEFYGSAYNTSVPVSSNTDIDLTNGIHQTFVLGASTTLRFFGWPASGQYAKVRVHFKASDPLLSYMPSLTTYGGGTIVYQSTFPQVLSSPKLTVTGTSHQVIDAWSTDNGVKVYISYVGQF